MPPKSEDSPLLLRSLLLVNIFSGRAASRSDTCYVQAENMYTLSKSLSDSKARLVKALVAALRSNGFDARRESWRIMQRDIPLWNEIVSHGLGSPQRQAWLSKVAFPDTREDEVEAAVNAGNNLNRLYDIARGKARIATDAAGRWTRGKKGYRIIRVA